MKGKYPPHFCNGIWGFYHDFVPWNMYFHYNTQHGFNSFNGANHPELMDTYIRFRRNQLTIAKKYAEEIKETKDAFYTDICDMKGRMVADKIELSKNCTCGAQIAMLMYKNYLYTGDELFLKNTALPVMAEVGGFYLDMLKKGDDGKYHIEGTTAYEGSPLFDDSITDLVAIRSLFGALTKVLPEKEGKIYKEKLDLLVDFTSVDLDADETENETFVQGIGKGQKCKGKKVLSVGILSEGNTPEKIKGLKKGKPIRKTFGTIEKNVISYYGFPDAEFSPIYPSGLVGIKDKNTDLYNMLYNNVCMHHPVLETEADDKSGMCMGWCMMPIYLARMGMAKELNEQLKRTISTWMAFPQGFGLYGGYEGPEGRGANTKRSTRDRFIKMDILKIDGEHKQDVIDFNLDLFKDKPEYHSAMNLWNFRHFDYETLPILSNAVTEMLLQSYDGTVRLFGAILKDSEVSFKLAAEGGFEISAVYQKGEFAVEIVSNLGKELKIAFDNVTDCAEFFDGDKKLCPEFKDKAYVLGTYPGMRILAISKNAEKISIDKNTNINNNVKRLGDAKPGCEREF